MLSNSSLPQLLKEPPAFGLPTDEVIYKLFGQGLSAAEWQKQLESLHYTWRPIWRQEILRKELRYFKLEIKELLSRPNTNFGPGSKSNSHKSVLLQIQGHTGEREQRLLARRLCGPEATSRTLENHVRVWKSETLTFNANSQPSNDVSLGGNNALLSINLAAVYGKRWEDLIDAATSATEEDEERTPVPPSPISVHRASLPPFSASHFQGYQASPLQQALTPPTYFPDALGSRGNPGSVGATKSSGNQNNSSHLP